MEKRMNTRKVTIYVKSLQAEVESGKKTRPDTTVPIFLGVGKMKMASFAFTYWPVRDSGGASTVSTQNVLPEDQRDVVQTMYEAALSQGFEIEVVDVAGREYLRDEPRLKSLEPARFPVLVTDSGDRMEGTASKEQIVSFLSKVAERSQRHK